jgi:aminopeptidase N
MFARNTHLYVLLFVLICGQLVTGASLRKYAPDRKVDILHTTIDVTPDFRARTVSGSTMIRFQPIAKPLTELVLDATHLDVAQVTSDKAIANWYADDTQIVITFARAIGISRQAAVTIAHSAEPKQGMYFRTPELGYARENMHLFTQGESHEARHWFPCYDYPNERFTSEVICRVPSDMTVISNGRLVNEIEQDGLKVSHWHQDKPHVAYLIALCAGHFTKITEAYRDIPMAFYVPTTFADVAKNSFKGTADMMAFFEQEIGVPYPWAQYNQVVAEDFVAGGMENTTLTILTQRTLHTADCERLSTSEPLVAHELVHQWFGDYVTCKDWTNLWLNEGFATYYENLYSRHRHGRSRFLYNMYQDARRTLGQRRAQPAIFHRTFENADQQFDYRAYQKGGWVLHMLRAELGVDLFRRCVKTYLQRHALGSVETADLRSIVEELSGRSFDRFFDQWVFYAGFPKLTVSYTWSPPDKLAKVSIKQSPSQEKDAIGFVFPVTLRYVCEGVSHDQAIDVDQEEQDIYMALPSKPEIVRFDPDYTILAQVDFKKSKPMLYAQLKNDQDVIGQILALQALKKHEDQKTIDAIKEQLNQASFHGIRIEAAAVLDDVHTDKAYDALIASVQQADERVREAVLNRIGNFYRQRSLDTLIAALEAETNPRIRTTVLGKLGRYHDSQADDLLVTGLNQDSYQNRIAQACVSAIFDHERLDMRFYDALRQTIEQRKNKYTAGGLAVALETLGRLAKEHDDGPSTREFLTRFANDPRERVAAGAISGLGQLGDRQAIAIVETFSRSDSPRRRVTRAAERALEKLHRETPLAPDEVVQLRKQVTELSQFQQEFKEQLEELKKRLEELKKRLEAKEGSEEPKDDSD